MNAATMTAIRQIADEIVCYRCSQPIEGDIVWDTEPGDPAFHPICAETTRREIEEDERN